MSDLQTASREGDGERICNQIFTPKLSNSVTRSSASGSCATEVKAKLFSAQTQIEVENIEVPDGANATAMVKEANGNTSTSSWSSRADAGGSAASRPRSRLPLKKRGAALSATPRPGSVWVLRF